MNIAGIVLAAGASTRMGSPKALLRIGDETFAGRLIRLMAHYCDPVILVVREGVPGPPGAIRVVNPDPDRGQLSSLQEALRHVPSDAQAFLFTPVDCPAVSESTLLQLIECGSGPTAAPVVRPRHQGKNGHPVLVSAQLIPALLELPSTASAKDLLRAQPTQFVEVEDSAVLGDIDTPRDYAQLVAQA